MPKTDDDKPKKKRKRDPSKPPPSTERYNNMTEAQKQEHNRKKRARAKARRGTMMVDEAAKEIYGKPIDDWDLEELAQGRPRASDGTFKGKAPQWINRATQEKIMERYKEIVRSEMNRHTVVGLQTVIDLLENIEEDDKGKWLVSAAVKADLAKWLVEHVIGKPTQPVQTDVSVKLQALLGVVMVDPGEVHTTRRGRQVLEILPAASHREVDEDDYPEEHVS